MKEKLSKDSILINIKSKLYHDLYELTSVYHSNPIFHHSSPMNYTPTTVVLFNPQIGLDALAFSAFAACRGRTSLDPCNAAPSSFEVPSHQLGEAISDHQN